MDWFWHAIWICLVVIPVTVLWVAAIFDVVFRRHDLHAGARIAMLVMILFLPVIGALIYFGFLNRPQVPREYQGELDTQEPVAPYQTNKML